MTALAALVTLSLFLNLAVSQVSYPSCDSGAMEWSYNSLAQNPCEVVAYLQSTCSQGVFTVPPLPPGYQYTGPAGVDDSNLCKCSTVSYSLASACDACQGEGWITWSEWATNCTTILPPSTFPNPVPSGTRVPHWALLDVTLENSWNMNKSISAGDSPEIGPGTLIGASSSFSPGPTGSKTANSPPTGVPANGTATPRPTDPASSLPGESPSGGSSHTAAIVGGVVGAIAFLAIVVLVIAYLRRQCNTRSPYAPYAASSITAAPSFPPVIDYASQTHSGARRGMSEAGTIASSAMPELRAPMGVYNPNNAASLPEVQDPEAPHLSVQALLGPSQGTGNTLANMHVSRPEEYNRPTSV